MKVAYLQLSINTFLDKLHIVLLKHGFKDISISYTDGVIHAAKRIRWFTKKAKVLIRITETVDHVGRQIHIMVNENDRRYDTALNDDEALEEELLDIIYRHF